jgi:hypothetical protein
MSDIHWVNITNYPSYCVSSDGFIKNKISGRILQTYIRNGYKSVTLCHKNKKKTYNIHTIVAEHFLQKPLNGIYVVNHINEDKLDNNIKNLEYTTYSQNTLHSRTSKRSTNNDVYDLIDFKKIPNFTSYMISSKGDVYSIFTKKLLCHTILPNKYHKIKLKSDDNIYKDMYIHVLVAMAYLSYIPSSRLIVINHKDSNKENNSIDNLEVITQKQNMQHSVIANASTIYRKKVYYINKNNEKIVFKSAKDASNMTGIDHSSIVKSCRNKVKHAGNIVWFYE